MSKKWADHDDDEDNAPPSPAAKPARLETAPDREGIKTVVEYVERDGKTYKITKKVRETKVTHRVNLNVVNRRKMDRFLQGEADPNDVMGKISTEKDEVHIEPRKAKKGEDDIAVEEMLGAQKKNVWAKFRKDEKPEEKADEKPAEPTPAEAQRDPNRYVPPSQRGGGTSLMDLRMQEQRDRDALTLRVTNLSEDVREGDLSDLFGQFGRIQRIFLAKNPETKASKGFAFITFATKMDAEKAIKRLNGHGYDNLVLRVEWAKPQQREATPNQADFRAELGRKPF